MLTTPVVSIGVYSNYAKEDTMFCFMFARVRVYSMEELGKALIALHTKLPNLLFTFDQATSGYEDGRYFMEYRISSVSEVSETYVKTALASMAGYVLANAGIEHYEISENA